MSNNSLINDIHLEDDKMYTPKFFEETEESKIFNIIEQYSFGILLTNDNEEQQISHLPFILDLNNKKLLTHLANNNPHTSNLKSGSKATVIFSGPDLYISPEWYEEKNLVPTWNYIAIHVHGSVNIISDDEGLHDILNRTTEHYENINNSDWVNNLDPDFDHKLRQMVTGVEIKIEKIEAKFKLGQNRTNESKRKMIKNMFDLGSDDAITMANIMEGMLNNE